MAVTQLSKFTRAVIASMMIVLLVATPLAASVAPAMTGVNGMPGNEKFSEQAHAQALSQLGMQDQACQSGQARAEQDTNGTIWFLGGCLTGILALGASYIIEPSPPASALVGQDDQFVAQYTDCYVEGAQAIQQRNALYGCLTLGVSYAAFYVVYAALIAVAASSTSTI